jgi:hypothetical protein
MENSIVGVNVSDKVLAFRQRALEQKLVSSYSPGSSFRNSTPGKSSISSKRSSVNILGASQKIKIISPTR